jgi:hypothetical protein
MSNDAEELDSVHVVVQARNGVLETTEVYVDGETAIKRYSELASDKRYIKTLLDMNAEIEDIDL